jgi:hypothetical protein
LAEGILPAYDLALKVIRTDSLQLCGEVIELQARIAEKEIKVLELGGPMAEAAREDERALEKMREKLYILQVQSEINLPEVRWRVANAMGAFFSFSKGVVVDLHALVDMKKPIHRHLMEQKWKKDGGLDLLVRRFP